MKRDNYVCQECGNKNRLIVHHKKDYKEYPKLKFNIDNGITLCRKCHPLYHPELNNNLKK